MKRPFKSTQAFTELHNLIFKLSLDQHGLVDLDRFDSYCEVARNAVLQAKLQPVVKTPTPNSLEIT
jgi:hypothetical protein